MYFTRPDFSQLYWRRGGRFERLARLGRLGALGVEAALFVAADALVRPESFENEFAGGGCQSRDRLPFAPKRSTCSSSP